MDTYSTPQNIERLICYAHLHLHLNEEDTIYVRNKLLFALKIDAPAHDFLPDREYISWLKSPTAIIEPLLKHAITNNLIQPDDKLQFETYLLDIVCPSPGTIIAMFDRIVANTGDIKNACKMLYDFGFKSNYMRHDDISSDVRWTASCEKSVLEITINTSKPEKSNKEIAAARKAQPTEKYPKCVLCKENVGFAGRPFRHTLRTIPLDLNIRREYFGPERWHMQYSPYNYYPEHCIVLADKHIPMHVNHDTVPRLFDFVDIFPHYFLGSNASLPIIGGSILSHDHYQGGGHVMPIHKAKPRFRLSSSMFPGIRLTIPDWYNSTIRIESNDRHSIERLSDVIREAWEVYNNEDLDIISKTDEQHSAITPIARKNTHGEYVLDIILRNNRADEKRPDGIFHVAPELFNIKKEGIGLIEAMGVFILPGRLSHEAGLIKAHLTGELQLDLQSLTNDENPLCKHRSLLLQLINDHGTQNDNYTAEMHVEHAINTACEKILKYTAVFKDDNDGNTAFLDFMSTIGFSLVNADN